MTLELFSRLLSFKHLPIFTCLSHAGIMSLNARKIDTWATKKTLEELLNKDKAVAKEETATDTISCLRWSPNSNYLGASSWDGKVRIYNVSADLEAKGVAMISAEAPVLSCDWSKVSQHGI